MSTNSGAGAGPGGELGSGQLGSGELGSGELGSGEHGWLIAECLLPGVTRESAEALAEQVRREIEGVAPSGVVFGGVLLVPEDEVLLCLFAGTPAGVRTVSERAGLPVDRVVGCVGIGWALPGRPA